MRFLHLLVIALVGLIGAVVLTTATPADLGLRNRKHSDQNRYAMDPDEVITERPIRRANLTRPADKPDQRSNNVVQPKETKSPEENSKPEESFVASAQKYLQGWI